MAQSTKADDILRLETELVNLRVKIGKQEELQKWEEGGAGSKFTTEFANIDSLYSREVKLQTRLDALYRSQA